MQRALAPPGKEDKMRYSPLLDAALVAALLMAYVPGTHQENALSKGQQLPAIMAPEDVEEISQDGVD